MKGENHLITGCAIAGAAVSALGASLKSDGIVFADLSGFLIRIFFPIKADSFFGSAFLCVLLSLLFYGVGLLLPDIDSKESMLGRYVHIPVKHRTWTHSFWFSVLFFVLGLRVHPFFMQICLGILVHIFMDGFSSAGIAFFYPLQHYIRYPSGAFVADGHKCKLYRTGYRSEKIFTGFVVIVCAVFLAYCGIYCGGLPYFFKYISKS